MATTTTGGALQASSGYQISVSAPPQGTSVPPSTVGNVLDNFKGAAELSLTFGTGAGQFDIAVIQDRTLNATTSETLDLYGGGLNDWIGVAALFRHVKYVCIYVVAGGDGSGVQIGDAVSQAWQGFLGSTTSSAMIFPTSVPYEGGSLAGVSVGATTNNLAIDNLGAVAVTYRICLLGNST